MDNYQRLPPIEEWPAEYRFIRSPLGKGKIPPDQLAEEGWALSLYWYDWGPLVKHGKYWANQFSDDLVTACVEMLEVWSPNPVFQWVTCIPSLKRPKLVADFAEKLAHELGAPFGLPFIPCIKKTRANEEQKNMNNSCEQVENLDGVFTITDQCLGGACLLVDDITGSGWTFTVTSALLRQAGCSAVYPMALALNSPRVDW